MPCPPPSHPWVSTTATTRERTSDDGYPRRRPYTTSVDSAKPIFWQHLCVKITDNSSATVLQLRRNLCYISPRLILCQFNCHNRIMIVVHTHKKNTDTTSSVCFLRIHRSTTENFCWDEIHPRDWLNVTHPLSLPRQQK